MLAARRKTMLFHGIFFAIHWQFPSLDKSGHASWHALIYY
jgi:hypothetical protein